VLIGLEIDARNFCIGYSSFAYFMLSYSTVGSLGIAIFRVLYVKVRVAVDWEQKLNPSIGLFEKRRLFFFNWRKSTKIVITENPRSVSIKLEQVRSCSDGAQGVVFILIYSTRKML
jgi:hypothetical protein